MANGKDQSTKMAKRVKYSLVGAGVTVIALVTVALVMPRVLPIVGTKTNVTVTTTTAAPVASTATTATTTTTQAKILIAASAFGAVPASFYPSSASFISSTAGFVLGGVPCPASTTKYCSELAITTNTGASWSATALTGISLVPRFSINQSTGSSPNGVSEVRFANSSVGYAFNPGLYVTTNGGTTFSSASVSGVSGIGSTLAVTSLEIANNNVTAIVSPRATSSQSTPSYLITASVSSSPSTFATETAPVSLSLGSIYFQNPLGQLISNQSASATANLFAPANTTSWQGITPACLSSNLASSSSIGTVGTLFNPANTSGTDGVAIGCTLGVAAGSSTKEVDVSTNQGASWTTMTNIPRGGNMSEVAAGSATNLSIAAESGASFIYSTNNGGASWSTFAFPNNALGAGGVPIYDLGYTTPTQAFCILGSPGSASPGLNQSTFFITNTAGASWIPITF